MAFDLRPITPSDVVFLAMDLQNDFAHKDGTFGRNGFEHVPVAAAETLPNVVRAWEVCRDLRIPVIGVGLTVLQDLDGNAIGIEQFRPGLRELFTREGFRSGTWGEQFLDGLPEPDYRIRKWGHSAMYLTELEKLLRSLGRNVLVMAGLGTNGVVEGTARDAVSRGWDVVALKDGVCAPDATLHEGGLNSLGHLGRLMTSDEFIAAVKG
ncbi:MAG: isochorismatase family protein [Propionibacteriales bacterium]|nr:isochorismatase family protein [Propionibacteriales bacterium]